MSLLELLVNDAGIIAGALLLWRAQTRRPWRARRKRCDGADTRGNQCANFNVRGCETDQCPEHCRERCRCGAGDVEDGR
jgi:hypothetical protein